MSKRLTDSEIWKKPWFYDLDDKLKLFWFYILSDCDAAGIWTANFKIVEAFIGKVDATKAIEKFEGQITILNNGTYWLINDFIRFQYGYPIKETAPMYKKINTLLEQRNLNLDTLYNTVSNTVCNTVYDTVKDKEEDKEKDIKGGVGGFKDREVKFISEVQTFSYPEKMLADFIRYWTEPNKSQTKMRWELEKTWDVERRLRTWASHDREFKRVPEKHVATSEEHLSAQW